jgi:serine protease Do
MPWPNARHPILTSNANEANCDVNCFDEFSTPNSGGRPSDWRSGSGTLTAARFLLLAVFCWPCPTRGEGWDALFSDYLLTGQEPRPAVARVVAPDGSGTSLGSGVLVDVNASQALVLTNWHVVRDSRSAVLVQFPDGFQSAGTILRVDSVWDLAAIVIWKPNVEPVQLAARAPVIGEPLTIAGYGRGPYREVSGGCTQYLSPGSGQPMELVELVGEARQGDSGGPIFNADGELAGILFGESGGRTVGASSPRVRAFLASVGSAGYAAPPATSIAAAVEAPPQTPAPMMTASHRPAAQEGQGASRLPTLALSAPQPPEAAATAGSAQPVTAVRTTAPPNETISQTTEPAAASDPEAAPSGEQAPAEPPPLEVADLVQAVRKISPGGNPQNLLAVLGAGALIVFGLRGISRGIASS